VLRVAGIGEPAVAELVHEKRDPLIAVAAVRKAGVAEEPITALFSCTRPGVSGPSAATAPLAPCAEVAMRSGAQLPGEGWELRGRIMHDAQLADVPVDFVFEEFRRQIECLGKDPAQRLGDSVKVRANRLARWGGARPDAP
jgi:hypothetical protein